VRIIGGIYRSRIISMPKGVDIRPTQDRVREAVFNMLGDINEKHILDIFAGSGAFGIEALSRGASHAVFVDVDARCVGTIKANLESMGIEEYQYDIMKRNAFATMPALDKDGEKFDIVFVDPPYYKDMARKCLICIDYYDILSPNASVVVEHFRKDSLICGLNRLVIGKEKVYGDTVITIYKSAL
jgi:16S rRNA (guanine(966)-N(2))-methyltransferase RsmD